MDFRIGQIVTLGFFGQRKFVVSKRMQGGMGAIYQVYPVQPGLPYALKTMLPTADLDMFKQECEMWLSVSGHENVASAIAYGLIDEVPMVLVDWYQSSLADVLTKDWSGEELTTLTCGIVKALDYCATTAKLIHQDIKPPNILLDRHKSPRVSDFGLSRTASSSSTLAVNLKLSEAVASTLRSVTAIGGTGAYLAPELLLGDGRASVQTDLYSLGITLLEVLAGEHPYTKLSRFEDLRATLTNVGRKIISDRGPGIEPLVRVALTCANEDIARRPGSYAEVLDYLTSSSAAIDRDDDSGSDAHEVEHQHQDDESRIVSLAIFLRQNGRFEEAEACLLKATTQWPENPVLRNALGTLYLSAGAEDKAVKAFLEATTRLVSEDMHWRDRPYTDPLMNLVRMKLSDGNHKIAYVYVTTLPDLLPKHMALLEETYSEVGWMYLYQGDLESSVRSLSRYSASKSLDELGILWFLQSAWLHNVLHIHGDKLANALLSRSAAWSVQLAIAACVVAKYSSSTEHRKLIEKLRTEHSADLREVSKEIGETLMPATDGAERIIIRSIDHMTTGGRFDGAL